MAPGSIPQQQTSVELAQSPKHLKVRISCECAYTPFNFIRGSFNTPFSSWIRSEVGGLLNWEIVSFRSCVRTRGLVA